MPTNRMPRPSSSASSLGSSASSSSFAMVSRSPSASRSSFVGPHLSGICAEGAAAATTSATIVHSSALRLCSVYVGSNAVSCLASSGLLRHIMKLSAPPALAQASVFMAAAQSSAVEQLGYRFALRVLVNSDSGTNSALQVMLQYLLSQVDVQALEVLGALPVQDVIGVAALGSVLPLLVGLAVQEALLVSDVIAGRSTCIGAVGASAGNFATAVGGAAGMTVGAAIGSLVFPGAGTALGSLVGSWMGARAIRSYMEPPALPFVVPLLQSSRGRAGRTTRTQQQQQQQQQKSDRSASATALRGASATHLPGSAAATSLVVGSRIANDGVQFSWGPGRFEEAIASAPSQQQLAPAGQSQRTMGVAPPTKELVPPTAPSSGSVLDALKQLFTGAEKLSDADTERMWAAQQAEAAVREKSRSNLAEYQRVRAAPPAGGKSVGAKELVLFFSQPALTSVENGAAPPSCQASAFGGSPPVSSGAATQGPLPFSAVPSLGGPVESRAAHHRSSVRFDELVSSKTVLEGDDALGRHWVS